MTPIESPIEWKFAAAVRDTVPADRIRHLPSSSIDTFLGTWDDDAEHLYACAPQITIGPYRADFLFVGFCCEFDPALLAVECDGHEFHERTKAQAARDKSRDRQLVGMGIHVMRFTGSEIHRDAPKCVREVIRFLDRRCDEAMVTLHPQTMRQLLQEAAQ